MTDTPSRVLVVEDDAVLRVAYRAALTNAGFEVTEAADAGAAQHALADDEARFDLAILDVGLPDITGLDLLTMIRDQFDDRTLPVLIVTGADELSQRIDGLGRGASDYVAKPVALPELVARVRSQVRTAQSWRAQASQAAATRAVTAEALSWLDPATDLATASHAISSAATLIPGVQSAICQIAPTATSEAITGADPGVVTEITIEKVPVGAIRATLATDVGMEGSDDARASLDDLAVMAASVLEPLLAAARTRAHRVARHDTTIATLDFETVYQPIVSLHEDRVAGYEALTRFSDGTRPDLVFADAASVGMRSELERATALAAVSRSRDLPRGAYLSVNLSPETALDVGFLHLLVSTGRSIVLELTEHDAVADYVALDAALTTVRDRARIAVDDAGAGYSGLSHIRALRPDVIKLDRALVQGIDRDPVGRAVVAGMVHYTLEIGGAIVAEGIETLDELRTLTELGVSYGQGYLLGRPGTVEATLQAA